jgi:hypothetical protein
MRFLFTQHPHSSLTRTLDKLPSQSRLVLLCLPFKTLLVVLGPKDCVACVCCVLHVCVVCCMCVLHVCNVCCMCVLCVACVCCVLHVCVICCMCLYCVCVTHKFSSSFRVPCVPFCRCGVPFCCVSRVPCVPCVLWCARTLVSRLDAARAEEERIKVCCVLCKLCAVTTGEEGEGGRRSSNYSNYNLKWIIYIWCWQHKKFNRILLYTTNFILHRLSIIMAYNWFKLIMRPPCTDIIINCIRI